MPLQRRIPKFGFKNINRVEYKPINLDTLESIVEKQGVSEITLDVLRKSGLVSKNDLVKILGRGELKSKITVQAHAISAKAKSAIEEKGGKVEII